MPPITRRATYLATDLAAVPVRRLAAAAVVLMLVCLAASPASSQAAPPSEYEVKAAFLYNFARFVEWPEAAQADDTLKICILGKDPFGDAFESIEGRLIRGRRLVVERHTDPGQEPCDILFVSASERRRLAAILTALKDTPVLTVSEVDGFAARGGMVNFYLDQKKVRFEINVDAVERAGLEMSAKLLRVARVIVD